MRKRLRAAGADIFDEFPKYGTSLRRLLGIRSEQALELFHQTVSMKSVGNLNDFVRDRMLEPSDSTDRVRDIIAHFEDLTKAHDAVERTREQLEALEPVSRAAAKYDDALAERDARERERSAVRLFIAEHRLSLLASEISALETEGAALWREQDTAKARQQTLTRERESLIEERAKAGGDRVGELERRAREARNQAETRRRTGVYSTPPSPGPAWKQSPITRSWPLCPFWWPPNTRGLPTRNAPSTRPPLAIGREKELQRKCDQITDELTSLQQRTSNLPVEQVEVRAELCAALGVAAVDLPYAGELLDVFDERAEWRGAAERVLRGFALSLLVPQQHYDAVTGWVNGRRLTFHGRGGKVNWSQAGAATGSPATGSPPATGA